MADACVCLIYSPFCLGWNTFISKQMIVTTAHIQRDMYEEWLWAAFLETYRIVLVLNYNRIVEQNTFLWFFWQIVNPWVPRPLMKSFLKSKLQYINLVVKVITNPLTNIFVFHLPPIYTLVKSIKIKNNKNILKPIKTSIKIIKVKINEAMMKSHVSEFKTNKIFFPQLFFSFLWFSPIFFSFFWLVKVNIYMWPFRKMRAPLAPCGERFNAGSLV